MRFLASLLIGAGTAAIAILLHQSLPPFGLATSLFFTYIAIWMIGRTFAARRYKFFAAIAWLSVILRGGTVGVGQEILVQGDSVGSALLLLGTFVLAAAILARN